MIVVMPNGGVRLPGVSAAAADRSSPAVVVARIEAIGKLHDASVEDLPRNIVPHVEKNYRASNRREHRAIAGLSVGGAETLRAAPSDLDKFAYIGVLSTGLQEGANAGMNTDFESRNARSFASPGETNGLVKLFWNGSGKDDRTVTDGPGKLSELLNRRTIRHEFHESEGGHTWIDWRRYLNTFAQRLFQ